MSMHTIAKHYVGVLQSICDDADIDLRTNYNGRGMGDRTCIAIVSYDVSGAFDELIAALADDDSDLADTLRSHNTVRDNMGKRTVMYWPTVQAES